MIYKESLIIKDSPVLLQIKEVYVNQTTWKDKASESLKICCKFTSGLLQLLKGMEKKLN